MKVFVSVAAIAMAATSPAWGHGSHEGGIPAPQSEGVAAPFDLIHTKISTDGNVAIFHIGVSERAGESKPAVSGQLAGSHVFSYVWPTTIDPYEIGFEQGAGILALAVTSHPDFDDTPLFDENGDGDTGNDGDIWHSHWIVLGPDDSCGEGALKVIDIAEGASPRLPRTWPGFPILLDSPGWDPTFVGDTVEVRVPFDDIAVVEEATYDGVTAGLRVNESIHSPLLCVIDLFDVASGDLSLTGRVNE
ncbi:MAG: hypothetical protein ACFB01_12710 [Cohaesibacteraceae bacterium]